MLTYCAIWGDIMEDFNKRLVYEHLVLNCSIADERAKMRDVMYSTYHMEMSSLYGSLYRELHRIVGFSGHPGDDFTSYVSKITLSREQKKEIFMLRSNPAFKTAMGKFALQSKGEIERLLGVKISPEGFTFGLDSLEYKGAVVAVKSEKQLELELNSYIDKLEQLFDSGAITKQQYDFYTQCLEYIYSYYISLSKGEQVSFREISNDEYRMVENLASESGTDYYKLLSDRTENLKLSHFYLQYCQKRLEENRKKRG